MSYPVFLMNSASGAPRLGGGMCQVTCRQPTPCLPPSLSQPCRRQDPHGAHCYWIQGDEGESQGGPSLLQKTDVQTQNSVCSLFLHWVLQAPRASLFPSWPSSQLSPHIYLCASCLYTMSVFPRRLGARRAGSWSAASAGA